MTAHFYCHRRLFPCFVAHRWFRWPWMEVQCIGASGRNLACPFLGHRLSSSRPKRSSPFLYSRCSPSNTTSSSFPRVFCGSDAPRKNGRGGRGGGEGVKVKVKENIWSVENDLAAKATAMEEEKKARRRRRRGRPTRALGRRKNSRVLVSGGMVTEVETVLQTQEPIIKPMWNTFASSVSGIWKGVGAVFSPLTAEMEPIGIGKQNENLYDCYTFSCIQNSHYSGGHLSRIHWNTRWVALNPFGEIQKNSMEGDKQKEKKRSLLPKKQGHACSELPPYESFDFESSDVLEEEFLGLEPGLVFFEDGSYSRGPVDIPVGDYDESKYFLSPTFKFEQCLVKGCHKRLRIVHTIEFADGGANIEIIRVAVYEEEWVRPSSLDDDGSDGKFDLKTFSLRRRAQPSELTGSWKVFEMSATPVFSEEDEDSGRQKGFPCVYLCTETLNKRSLPENRVCFGEEELLDMQDATVLWLPGGVTAYADVNNDGILCIGVGWYSEEGTNLVMERDYGMDGKLKEVRWKSEVKRRWTEPPLVNEHLPV